MGVFLIRNHGHSETHQSVCCTALAFVGYIGHVSEYDGKRYSKNATYGNHGEVPPCVYMD
jgi:hypothetical protein